MRPLAPLYVRKKRKRKTETDPDVFLRARREVVLLEAIQNKPGIKTDELQQVSQVSLQRTRLILKALSEVGCCFRKDGRWFLAPIGAGQEEDE